MLLAALCLAVLPSLVMAAEESDFVELSTAVPQLSDGFVSVIIGNNSCTASGEVQYPNTMFTIRPYMGNDTDGYGPIVVKSFPADLVTTSASTHEHGMSLEFVFNEAVIGSSNNITEGGVLIIISKDQLMDVVVQSSTHVQILPGFQSLSTLSASSRAQVTADFSTLPRVSSQVFVLMDTFAKMTLISNLPLYKLHLSTSAQLRYDGWTNKNFVNYHKVFQVDSDAVFKMKGQFWGGGYFSSGATVVLDGDMEGTNWANSHANLSVSGLINGVLKVDTNAQVTTNTTAECAKLEVTTNAGNMTSNNATSAANCVKGSVEPVVVVINELPLTLQGTRTCSGDANSCTCTVVSFATTSPEPISSTGEDTPGPAPTKSPTSTKSPSSTSSKSFSAGMLLKVACLIAVLGYM
jgi:hypothetical protein